VTDVKKKLGDVFAHEVEVLEGALEVGAALELKVDHAARSGIRANHSATHLLHEALRMVLGDHVAQKGSLVAPDRLRFDIAHPKPITAAEIAEVEDIANAIVLANAPVVTRLMGIEEARASGARALFGEKYGDEVRVVSMGVMEGGANGPRPYSVELCGGTHVERTGDIGLIAISGESAVAAGVRRIEARTRNEARRHLRDDSRAFAELSGLLRAPAGEAAARLEAVLEDRRKLERELNDARRKLAMGGGGAAGDAIRDVAGVKFYARAVSGVDMKDLKSLADEAKPSVVSGIIAIVATGEDGKASLVVAVTPDLTTRFNAVDLVRLGSAALGGKGGGGRPDMAQAGGPDGAKADEALAAVEAGVRARAAA
jgi:alanyl-tRNA synthetase